jgi:colicin import membrane protein
MQAARFEGSLLTSLSELKSIEQQRVAEERAAVRRIEELRVQELADTERRNREAAEAKQREVHEAALAIERARADAEREARLRVEAAEAAERARQLVALEQERQAQELALRKAEVAKKRPTWMLAVTGLALVMAAVLVVFTVKFLQASEEATQAQHEADARAKQAREEADQARIALEKVEQEVKELDGRVNVAMKRVAEATSKAELVEAAKALKKLNEDKAAAARRVEDARRARERAIRLEGVKKVCAGEAICKEDVNKK